MPGFFQYYSGDGPQMPQNIETATAIKPTTSGPSSWSKLIRLQLRWVLHHRGGAKLLWTMTPTIPLLYWSCPRCLCPNLTATICSGDRSTIFPRRYLAVPEVVVPQNQCVSQRREISTPFNNLRGRSPHRLGAKRSIIMIWDCWPLPLLTGYYQRPPLQTRTKNPSRSYLIPYKSVSRLTRLR